MGIYFNTCDCCGECFGDCGDYAYCGKCDSNFCDDCTSKMKFKKDEYEDIIECNICANEEMMRKKEKSDILRNEIYEEIKSEWNLQ
jgi:hypothetical protein